MKFKKNTISNFFGYTCIHIIEIPTNKGAYSYKLKLSKIVNYLFQNVKAMEWKIIPKRQPYVYTFLSIVEGKDDVISWLPVSVHCCCAM